MEIVSLTQVLGNLLIFFGIAVFAVAVIGLFRFTDTYQRVSAVGTAAGLGISLIIIGVFCFAPSWLNFIKLVLILVLQLATSSIGTMAIARSAYLTGSKMSPGYFNHLDDDTTADEAPVETDQDIEDDTTNTVS